MVNKTGTGTCSVEPSPDDTRTSLTLRLSVGGLLFSLSSCPSDGESPPLVVLAAEVELGVLDMFLSFAADTVYVEKQRENKSECDTQ